MHIEVVFCAQPGSADRMSLQLPEGSTLHDALAASGLLQRHALPSTEWQAGIWGRVMPLGTPLRDRDRVELYRPLQVDPKEARRLRYKKSSGIAARRSPP